jgi:hypothetical protein
MIWQITEGVFAIIGVGVTVFVGLLITLDAIDNWKWRRKKRRWRSFPWEP